MRNVWNQFCLLSSSRNILFIDRFFEDSFFFLSAIGSAAVRPNIVAFGADQIQEGEASSRYFEICILVINLANIIYTIPIILITSEEHYWFILHSVGLAMLCIAILFYLIGWRYYHHIKPYDSPVVNFIPVLRNAFQTWRQSKHRTRGTIMEDMNVDPIATAEEGIREGPRVSSTLDYAKVIHYGKFSDRIVDDVKLFCNALIIFILILPNKLIYDQVNHKNLSIETFNFEWIADFYYFSITKCGNEIRQIR